MNKMERLQEVNETIAALRSDSFILGEQCGQIGEYVSAEKFLPADLMDKTIRCLQNIKDAQISCGEGFRTLCGSSEIPETYAEAEDKMEKLHELFCKEEILQAAKRFQKLETDNPLEIIALREAQEKIVIADPEEMTLEGCRERYQPYIDFLVTLEEEEAGKRIQYVRKLEEYFSPELIAGAVITRDIHDPQEVDIPFVEEDLDDYDEGFEENAVPSAMSDEETDEIADGLEKLTEDVTQAESSEEEAAEADPEVKEAVEEACEAAETEAAGPEALEAEEEAETAGPEAEEAEEEAEAAGPEAEEAEEEAEAVVSEAEEAEEETEAAASEESEEEAGAEEAVEEEPFREDAEKVSAEEITDEGTEEAGEEQENTASGEEFPAMENYLDDFDEKYIEYYQMATGAKDGTERSGFITWPASGETFGPEGVKNVLESLGFRVADIEEQDRIRNKYENYKVVLEPQDDGKNGKESAALANFRQDACEDGFRVVCLYGSFTGEELSRAFREIGNRHHTLILFQDPVTQGVRRSLVRLVRREGLRKIFAVLDRVACEYMNNNYREEEINRIFLDIIMPGPDAK